MVVVFVVAVFTAADSEPAVLPFTGGGYRYGGFHRFHHGGTATPTGPTSTGIITSIGGSIYAPSYYYPNYYYPYRHCRIIWTYYGPRKICRYRPWWRHHTVLVSRTAGCETKQAPARAPVVHRVMSDASIPVLELPGLHFPRRQIFHPPLGPALGRPVAEARGFLGLGRGSTMRGMARRRLCRVASRIISTNSDLSAMAGSSRTSSASSQSAPRALNEAFPKRLDL